MAGRGLVQWIVPDISRKKHALATPNYGFEKRQRELAKKQKKEEKLQAKALRKTGTGVDHPADDAPGEQPAADAGGQPPAPAGEGC